MDDTPTQPLTRSLDPLDGEALNGYLLRLAYRLRVTPGQVATLTGCKPFTITISRWHLLHLDTHTFAHATRLTPAEAADLTLTPWKDRYPPIARSLPTTTPRPRTDDWLFNATPRHCPQCLAGDGSLIQRQYGGPWKRIWHLPITFACPDHDTFLHQGCSQNHPLRRQLGYLIDKPMISALHPAQCRRSAPTPTTKRKPACGTRLDLPASAIPTRPSAAVIKTQQRLLDLLDPRHPAEGAVRLFTDLRLLTSLLCASWPRGRHLVEPHATQAITEHVRAREQSLTPRDAPPDNPIAAGALLTAAIAILDTPDLARPLAQHIHVAWPGRPNRAPWAGSSLVAILRDWADTVR